MQQQKITGKIKSIYAVPGYDLLFFLPQILELIVKPEMEFNTKIVVYFELAFIPRFSKSSISYLEFY